MNEKTVAFTPASGYGEAVEKAMERQFEILALDELFRPGMRVVLKPNLLMKRSPERATTTHPDVVSAAVRALQRRGVSDIVLADSPGGPFTKTALEGIYTASRMTNVAGETGCRLNYDTTFDTLDCRSFTKCASFSVIRPILEADAVLNLPKLKTHGMTMLSGGVKNLFGCIPGLQKPEMHYRFQTERAFCEMLVDLALAVSPAATIIDAVVSMEGDGPSGGIPKQTDFLAGSRNPFALDTALAEYMKLPAVTMLDVARERGLTLPYEQLTLQGEPPAPVDFLLPRSKSLDFLDVLPSALRPMVSSLAKRWAEPRPEITKRCIGCGKCAESCPAHIIRVENRRAVIDAEKCIRCFCCHEMCPVEAIRIKRLKLFNI